MISRSRIQHRAVKLGKIVKNHKMNLIKSRSTAGHNYSGSKTKSGSGAERVTKNCEIHRCLQVLTLLRSSGLSEGISKLRMLFQ